eukprot:TRINITY_DN4700_c1_g1_i2.p1 TRINITY_DN4700_c1_g1~~TRINITY_DN4700_c1_g1_i2.p1  ORF type:complete len:632 (+),score=94.95 TRINITY_DN4700_c1_g1_i2:125-2020(+)
MSLATSCTTPFSPPPPCSTTAGSSSQRLLTFDPAVLLLDRCESIDQILQTHAALLRSQSHLHPVLSFKLQRSYSSFGRLDYARSLFDRSPNPNVVSWSALIHAYTINGLGHHALLLYHQVLTDGTIQPNAFTFSSVLKACSHLPQARAFHSQAIKFTFDSDPYVRTTLLDLYARGGDVDSAQYLFDTMPQRRLVSATAMITCYAKIGDISRARRMFDEMDVKDVVCWNVMIDGYTQHGRPNEALDLFRKMLMMEMRPNEVTFPSVLSACAQLGALESGKWLHSYIKSNRIRLNVQVSTALIDMYCKCGSLEDACLVFDKIVNKDVVAWNSMITGYAMHGHSREALQLFSQMCSLGLRPTAITFIGVLSACVHAGLVEEGRRFFQSMKDEYGIEPEIKHYGCMVDLLGRAGFVEEAYELAKSMTIEQDPVLWGSLLASCRLHGYRNIGESIAKFLLEKGLANSGTYVLLSNIYAAEGKWDEVVRVRTLMKDRGIQKEPGCSSIEVDNKTHEFLAGDLKHPRTKGIYLMLEELNGLLKAHGYVPQTEIVLLDIEESDKERALGVHSEKLAIAFGLISTQPGTPIRIVKNLRVCSDCHTVTKLISKITGRKIVVRDRNRFHHFVEGSCSCRDYW